MNATYRTNLFFKQDAPRRAQPEARLGTSEVRTEFVSWVPRQTRFEVFWKKEPPRRLYFHNGAKRSYNKLRLTALRRHSELAAVTKTYELVMLDPVEGTETFRSGGTAVWPFVFFPLEIRRFAHNYIVRAACSADAIES